MMAGPSIPKPWKCVAALCVALAGCQPAAPPPARASVAPSPRATAPPTPVASAPAPAGEGADFGDDARLLYRVVACGGTTPLPAGLDASVVAQHCAHIKPLLQRYQDRVAGKALPFMAKLVPERAPATVVYPFGGGDLLSALTTYRNTQEITTISLELAGDPRRISHLHTRQLAESLDLVRRTITGLLSQSDSTSESLKRGQRGDIPGQLAFFLVGLAAHGQEPVALRFFRLLPDGRIHYLTREEIAAEEGKAGTRRHAAWVSPDFSRAFENSELTFRAVGGGPLRVHRHIGANLADDRLPNDGPLLLHLRSKGRVAALTKASSYCLWNPHFSHIRDYLLANMDLMISDSTGIPPALCARAGFVQDTYGRFRRSFLPASAEYSEQFRKLWAAQPLRPLPFRYGYPDARGAYHLLVTRRSGKAQPS